MLHSVAHRVVAVTLVASLGLASLGGCAGESASAVDANQSGIAAPLASNANNGLITLRGLVRAATPSHFMLDYGSGTATVEMDDWDWYQEGRAIKAGDRVTVTGRVDADLFQRARLEARTVYVENLGTYFYASGVDEEDFGVATNLLASAGASDLVGTVTTIEGREFMIGSDAGAIRVDTSEMQDNPLDGEGNPQVRAGDRLYVWGRLDIDPGEADEMMAQGIIVLRPDRTKSGQTPSNAAQAADTNAAQAADTNAARAADTKE